MAKVSKRDWKVIIIGLILTALFLGLRAYLTGRTAEWMLGIFDLMIGIFGGGVFLFILGELFGKNVIKRLRG